MLICNVFVISMLRKCKRFFKKKLHFFLVDKKNGFKFGA